MAIILLHATLSLFTHPLFVIPPQVALIGVTFSSVTLHHMLPSSWILTVTATWSLLAEMLRASRPPHPHTSGLALIRFWFTIQFILYIISIFKLHALQTIVLNHLGYPFSAQGYNFTYSPKGCFMGTWDDAGPLIWRTIHIRGYLSFFSSWENQLHHCDYITKLINKVWIHISFSLFVISHNSGQKKVHEIYFSYHSFFSWKVSFLVYLHPACLMNI